VIKIRENVSEVAQMAVGPEKRLHSSIISMLEVMNSFIKTRFIVKSRESKVLVGSAHILLSHTTALAHIPAQLADV